MEARTHVVFLAKVLMTQHEIYELAKFGPTANNYCPMRLTFVKSQKAKEKLIETASEGNRLKIASAQTIIIAYDVDYLKHISLLAPRADVSKIAAQTELNAINLPESYHGCRPVTF